MPSDYNPNSIWTSKKKEYQYKPGESAGTPAARPPEKVEMISGPGHKKRNVLIGIIIGVAIIALAVFAYFILKPVPPLNVSIVFTSPSHVLVDDPFNVSIAYANNSQTILKNATLAFTLPIGVSVAGQSSDQRVIQQPLGDLGPGTMSQQNFNLIVTGNPNSVLQLAAKLTYNTDASGNSPVQSSGEGNLVVGGSVLGLTITSPSSVFSGQNFDVVVSYVNNAPHTLGDVKVAMQFPTNFVLQESSVAPDSSTGTEWDLGPLAQGASGSFTITGNIAGQAQTLYSITGSATTGVMGKSYTLANPSIGLHIAESPLTIGGGLSGGASYIAGLHDQLQYVFSYTNNSNVTLEDAVVTAQFTGGMFDFTTLVSNGSFNSLTDTVTWSPANTSALLSVAPGQSGTVQVSLSTKSAFPIRLPSDKDYTLKAQVQIQSPTVPPNTAASSTISLMTTQNKVGGVVALAAVGYYNDPTASIKNTGPYPPKVNKQTEYTIHWRITDYSTDIANATVSAYLQSGTTCTGVIKSNIASSTPTCNSATGEVMWTIPSVSATRGVISPPAEAIFQVENTPAVNQVGQDVTLLGPTTLQATDQFTGAALQASAAAVMTNLPQDTSLGNGSHQVSQ